MNIREILGRAPVVPVLVIDKVADAVPLARALVGGGLPVLEVTLRTEAAWGAVDAMVAEVPDAIVGVGTVLRPEDFARARAAGAGFAVSPGLTPALAAAARASQLPYLPGVMTPGEVMAAVADGHTALKLFPAQQAGGLGMLKALGAVFRDVVFCPTGGITADTLPDYLALSNVACVGGSWVAPSDAIKAGAWDRITTLARAASRRP
jgi:2-dehydro-3-deoxyphosphogluconate aldolase / (4S)-4-hydroxy-2-oxoglutarate aldolase